jgi:hypothetical protein
MSSRNCRFWRAMDGRRVASSADQKLIRIKTLDGFCGPRYFGESEAVLQRILATARTLAGGEAPSRSADPAAFFGNVFVAIEPRDLLPASFGKRFGQRAFGCLVAASGAGKDRHGRNPSRKIVKTAPLDPKHRAGTRHLLPRFCPKTLVRRHRQDQASAVGETIEPVLGRPRAAGIDVDDIGLIERHRSAVAFDDFDVWVAGEIGFGARGEFGFVFYSGNPA